MEPDNAKKSVTFRVPTRSMIAPICIEKNRERSARIEIAIPIQKALAPISSAQSGTIRVSIGIWLRLKNPVANIAL